MFNAEDLFRQLDSYLAKSNKEKLLQDIKDADAMKYIEPIDDKELEEFKVFIVPMGIDNYKPMDVIRSGILSINGSVKEIPVMRASNKINMETLKRGHIVHVNSIDEAENQFNIYGYKKTNKVTYSYQN